MGNDFSNAIILDMNGKTVLKQNLNDSSNELNTASLESGSYILVLKNERNYLTKKLQIESDKK
jgi:hypothetical protein